MTQSIISTDDDSKAIDDAWFEKRSGNGVAAPHNGATTQHNGVATHTIPMEVPMEMPMAEPEAVKKASKVGYHIKTRLFSFVALSALVSSCGYVVEQGYYVAVDSFVAPAILTPNNDLVLDQKLKLQQVLLEKSRVQQLLEESNASLAADEKVIIKLNDLKEYSSNSLVWTKATTGQQVSMGSAGSQALTEQNIQLHSMLARQERLTNDAEKNLSAGLIQRPEYDRELSALNQVQIALFENDRNKIQNSLALGTASMGQQALSSGKSAMPTPEQIMNAIQLNSIDLQLISTEADMRSKLFAKVKEQEEVAKIDRLESELRERPIFKAMEKQQDVAFAPYTALHGVAPGMRLVDCTWGIFNCRDVGKVEKIIPGETILPDIFGSGTVRGQFITLSLYIERHDESMQSKVLRVRHSDDLKFNFSLIGNSKFTTK
jgi:hypothetical protein